MSNSTLSQASLVANAIRSLAIDTIEKAKSGHPGAPMGMADIASQLWLDTMNYNPKNPHWQNRDRFILSNGHASALLYSALHLVGYDISIEDMKNFRQFDSKTPGHPEYTYTPGVEMTTGPLGQGIATAVGFALAEKLHAKHFNKENYNLVDHNTYVFLGDGCLMEGISQEALSLAASFELGKLIVLYDDNEISIDGNVKAWFKDDTAARFKASGWHVIENVDGHNAEAISQALAQAKQKANAQNTQPILICFKTQIGFGSPNKVNTSSCHGSPLGEEEIQKTKQALGIDYKAFEIPTSVYEIADKKQKGENLEKEWNSLFEKYSAQYPELAKDFTKRVLNKEYSLSLNEIEAELFKNLELSDKAIATRVSSQKVLSALAPALPELLGGSADLSGSVGTVHCNAKAINASNKDLDFTGNYLHYGVREFGMACVMNGVALYGGYIPFGGTFHVFSDYMRSAIRSSALMKQRVIYVLTHDSIGVGEDGPTHQPIEHNASLRLMPNLQVWRPADTKETALAWLSALEFEGPTALILSRQNLAQLSLEANIDDMKKGAYILCQNSDTPECIIISNGSELALAKEVYTKLENQGKKVRLVSMPCTDLFDKQDAAYKEKVLPSSCTKRLAIEAGSPDLWYKYVGLDGKVVGMTTFGESAPAAKLFEHFGFTAENICKELTF